MNWIDWKHKHTEDTMKEKVDFTVFCRERESDLSRVIGRRSKICQPKTVRPLFPHIRWALLAPTFLFVYLCQCLLWTDKHTLAEALTHWADIKSAFSLHCSVWAHNKLVRWTLFLSDGPSNKNELTLNKWWIPVCKSIIWWVCLNSESQSGSTL